MSSKEAPKIVVLGSCVADRTYRVEALPLPGESAVADQVRESLGGKGANLAVAARRLGGDVFCLGRVGDDEAGRASRADLEGSGVRTRLLETEDAPTGSAAVVLDEAGENQIAVHLGANLRLSAADVVTIQEDIAAAPVLAAVLEVPLDAVRKAAEISQEAGRIAILNAAPVVPDAQDVFALFDVVVANRGEAEQLLGIGIGNVDDALAGLRALRDAGVREPVITLGAAGAVFVDRGRGVHVPAPKIEAVDATGAGDAFVGALAAFRARGWGMDDAVPAACRYATLTVRKPGTRASYPDRQTFEAAFPPVED